jgi:PAS domain S-box-containing protein
LNVEDKIPVAAQERGDMSAKVNGFDWSKTPLGAASEWPDALKVTSASVLKSRFPQAIIWGESLTTIHNDAFVPILGGKPEALGRPFNEIWSEAWDSIEPIYRQAMAGEATYIEDFPLVVERGNGPEQAYFTFCYSPIADENGKVVGMLDTVVETTGTVLAAKQRDLLDFLDTLTRNLQQTSEPIAIMAITTRIVAEHLCVTNCAYADMDADQDGFTIRGDWARPGSPSIVGRYRLADFGKLAVEKLTEGKPLIISDNLAELAPEEAATFQKIGVAATICMPLIKHGRLTALMAVHDALPRQWTDYDLSVIREVTDRSWAHIERVRSEDQLRRAQEVGGVGLFTLDILRDTITGTPEFFRLFGLEPGGELPASAIEALVLPDDGAVVSSLPGRRTGTAPLQVQYRIRRPDTGAICTIARSAEYERDPSGTPLRMLGTVRDITEQSRALQALEQSEAQFRTFAQSMPSQVWTAMPEGKLEWFNERVYAYTGVAPGALDGERWTQVIHVDDLSRALVRWRQALQTGDTYEVEFRVRRADGAYRWHLSRAIPIYDREGRIDRWIGTNTDIHERKLTEAETARDRERMWAMSQDILLVCDLEGRITDVNPSATRLLGWAAEDMIGHSIVDFIHPEDQASTLTEFTRIGGGETALAFENRYRRKCGDYLLLDWTAVADGDRIHGVGRDITEARSIARDQQRIWNLSPVLKLVATAEARIIKVNPAWLQTLGWEEADVTGRPLLDFIVESDSDRAGAAIERLVLGEPQSEQELSLATKHDGPRRIAWNFVAESGSIFGFGRDITEQRSAEDALRQAQKMEAVGQLTGGIAHDFNNLLQGVTGSLELIQHRLDQGRIDDIDRFLKGAATSANRAAALTHRLLAFSRRQPLDPRPVRANPLVSSMEDMLRRTLGEAIDLELVLAGGLWLTRCDPNQLESAILNLAINARDAMPGGGKLIIETSNAHLDSIYAARASDINPGQYVCVSVTDTGSGMDQTTISRAFEPFFTTKPIGQGTGLGLSMIYGFARQSEGHAKIYSELGLGTTIKLYLPRYRGAAEADEEVPHLTADHATEFGEVVLVVEDEPVVRGLIVEVLSGLGYRAIEATDGPSGLQILQSKRRIDLLVTDIGLPGLNGRQVADAARVQRPDLKVLFMTGYAENAALASGFLEPGMEMITKPFSMEALASRIRGIVAGG